MKQYLLSIGIVFLVFMVIGCDSESGTKTPQPTGDPSPDPTADPTPEDTPIPEPTSEPTPTEVKSFSLVGSWTRPSGTGLFYGLYVDGDYVYVADQSNGMRIFDVSDPADPTEVGTFATVSLARDVYVEGNFAFVADGLGGLHIVNITNKSIPTAVGSYTTVDYAFEPIVVGSYIFLADDDNGLLSIDFSTPATPTLADSINVTSGRARSVAIVGNMAYVTTYTEGLLIANIEDPTNLLEVTTLDTTSESEAIAVAGDYAYQGDDNGLKIIDITQVPPVEVGAYLASSSIYGIAIRDDIAFCASALTGLKAIDISNKTNPVLIATYPTGHAAWDVQVVGDYIYLADGAASVPLVILTFQ
ncbi:MAG: hypothetical protein JXJ04_24935 [Spirochaetales bacterium]|nr:hypothetical protein [Spirochaetales bacterium]